MNNASKTPLVDLLRHCSRDAWAEITEPNGWSYHTNIGKLLHDAADEIDRLKSAQPLGGRSARKVTEMTNDEMRVVMERILLVPVAEVDAALILAIVEEQLRNESHSTTGAVDLGKAQEGRDTGAGFGPLGNRPSA